MEKNHPENRARDGVSLATRVRWLPLEGAWNVRDLGGYPSRFGGVLRSGVLLRGDSPHRLTADDLAVLAPIGIRSIVDLRRPEEVAHFGSGPLADLVQVILHVPLRQAPHSVDPLNTDELVTLYRQYVSFDIEELVEIISFVADPRHYPVFIHCHAGKDRTGVVIALILAVLGVPDVWIASDYALTQEAFTNFLQHVRAQMSDMEATAESRHQVDTMLRLLAGIRGYYGSVEQLLGSHGLTTSEVARLREGLLEPVYQPKPYEA
ncbi:tyrosine-protein phosphatase [Ferrimicrobium sp.]|uniref:tyrosine-protein phosphatase n=1 Tax=Ferrimicrobium sp. TaxID=2926050 RepID=UPI002627F1E7|nr:tyrosine-protein phosphatase [Ferrimicrobium sp.]